MGWSIGYECRWAEEFTDGERAMLHWHVGRRPGSAATVSP